MKIDIFDVKEFIDANNLQEIKSPILFQRGNVPHPDGLVSNEIFGVTTKSRRETYAYIDLHGHFFNPHIYKAIHRMFRNIDKIVNGESYYSINEKGYLVLDENGDTGIDWLYENWEKIKWEDKVSSSAVSMRDERINLLNNCKKNEIFMQYQIVIPAFYRDVKSNASGGETDDINNMYANLIRLSSLLENRNLFDFQFNSTNFNIQNTIVNIYDYFKNKIESKGGLIRKYLMGKNTDYATRTVITAPTFHADLPEDLFVDFEHAALPISQVCSLAYPFIIHYVKEFFERELIDSEFSKSLYNPATGEPSKEIQIDSPETFYSEKYIKKHIDSFIKDPESRFDIIEVPIKGNKKYGLSFNGKRLDGSNKSELATIAGRPMTWTDLLYMACEYVTRDKHCLITRYPLLDEFGIFPAKIRVTSTTKTIPMQVGDYIYKWYPYVELDTPSEKIGSKFIDSVQFSNSYLAGIDGDYDGDQTTVKIVFTQEANDEIENVTKNKAFFINSSGGNIRKVGKEALQTFYVLTKDPNEKSKPLTKEDKEYFLSLKKEDFSFSNLVSWLGDTVDITDNNHHKNKRPSKYNCNDTMVLTHADCNLVEGSSIVTTLGRFIFNKILIEGLHFENIFNYQNKVFTAGEYGKFDAAIANALKDDIITVEQMYEYVDTRDWFGLELHGVITSSFTPGVLHIPPKVDALRKKLFEENKEAIKNADERVMNSIEGQIIAAMKEELKDDIGMDLYNSGARGSVNNHLKNIMLTRGAIKNPVTHEYDIIQHSLMDGLEKKDIPAHSNMIVSGAYPKAVGTQVSGYMLKELVAALQSEVLAPADSDCGSKGYLTKKITQNNLKDNLYRFIVDSNGKLVELTMENSSQFIGKDVKMRSPMYCIGYGKEKHLCNKCAGNFYYKLGKSNIGLASAKLAGTLSNLNLQKFHDNVVRLHEINPDDLLI